MNIYSIARLFCFVILTTLCVACGPSHNVPLTYPVSESTVLPSPTAPRVTVVLFQDQRTQAHLGSRGSNEVFEGNIPVPEWISRSFADALMREGIQVSYADAYLPTNIPSSHYLVTGAVRQATLEETSITGLRVSMQVDISVSGAHGNLLNESLSATKSETVVTSTSMASTLLQETVQEMIQPGVEKVAEIVGR